MKPTDVRPVMAEEPDPEALKRLEERIARAKGEIRPPPAGQQRLHQGELAWRMVIELVTGMAVGLAIGYGIDWALGTMPAFMVIFVLLGFAAGVRTMLATARSMRGDTAPDGDRKG